MPGNPEKALLKKRIWLAIRILGTLGGFGYVLSIVDIDDVGGAITKMPILSFAACLGIMLLNMALGAFRWGILFRAYGAKTVPPLLELIRIYFIGFFYNTYVPGGVGGDAVRGIVTREAFGEGLGGVTVVVVERLLGLTGLLTVSATAYWISPIAGSEDLKLWAPLGMIGALAVVGLIPVARSLPLPGRLYNLAQSLPQLRSKASFGFAYILSLGTQSLIALSGYALLVGMAPNATLANAFVIVPVAAATAYLPITVGGAGAREAAFIFLCSQGMGMPATDATAVSLLLWFSALVIGAIGGVWQLAKPAQSQTRAEIDDDSSDADARTTAP
jgi:uncharacterized membrane protein YbhN (UPF0104 family)